MKRYFIVNFWYSTGFMTREYYKEESSLEELLTVKGSTGKKIVKKEKNGNWLIVAHWHKNNWKIC